jgi:amidase
MTALPPLHFRSASDVLAALRARNLASAELTDHLIARIESSDPRVNAVVARDFERARARARAADEATARGESWGALHGLPMTIKDTLETEGLVTTAGAPELAKHVPARNAAAVQKLVDAGAIVLGKTNVPLYAGDFQSYNAVYGTTNNPWDLSRGPGGSSGGSAAALATGMTPLELGSDIGGSIRNPAHFCGVFGHKPTWGVVSGRGHIPGPPGAIAPTDLGVVGPLARTAEDLALALGVLVGPEEPAQTAWKLALPPPRATRLAGLRVAAWLDDAFSPVDAAVRARLEAAADALAKAGARVDRAARPGFAFADAYATYALLLHPILWSGLPPAAIDAMRAEAARIAADDRSQRGLQLRGALLLHREWIVHNELRHQMMAAWDRFFREFDVVIAPVMPVAAFPHDPTPDFHARRLVVNGEPRSYFDGLHWASLATMAGLPATVAPVGRTAEGLPVGAQILGARFDDRTTIEVARLLAQETGGFAPPPAFA